MQCLIKLCFGLFLSAVASHFAAAVEVVDYSKESPQLQLQKVRQHNAEMRLLLNDMQREIANLRGEFETLQYKFTQLETAQREAQALAAQQQTSVAGHSNLVAEAPDQAKVQEAVERGDIASYQAAFEALKNKQYDSARELFNSYINAFPAGEYTSNSYYWLGEIYLLANQSELAITAFSDVYIKFPQSSKAFDARYKLAQIYSRSADDEKAKAMLKSIIDAPEAEQRTKTLAQDMWREKYAE